MSLRRHLEECVKPWLSANAYRPTLLGALEDADQQVSSDMRRTIGEILGAGEWTTIRKPWESRRDAMLDVLAKAMPFKCQAILQLDPVGARPLVEALSGRWTFEKDRRDTRNASWHVANAFTLLLSRLELWKATPKTFERQMPPSAMSS